MSQLSFDLGGPEPLPPEDTEAPNLFYALRPPADACLEIMAEASEVSRRERLRPPRPASVLHLTLCKIGHYGHVASVIETARRIGDSVSARGFDVALARLMHFQGAGAVVFASDVVAAELSALNADLVRALRREGFKPPTSFKPHVTFVYEKRFLLPETGMSRPIGWRATEFELVLSPPGETRHEVLGVWPLA